VKTGHLRKDGFDLRVFQRHVPQKETVMSNLLKMAKVQSILSLHAQGWSARRIAQELGVDRETVGKYVSQQSCGPKPANLPTGSDGSKPANLPPPPGAD
jgi:hypothetical protein